ncbi:hypothetical protein OIU84_008337 [Salix udensis]|uniref:Uncharacterized protein n=1 Tax=Salix udensis TaxID=889485 RepID=A0AAD6JVL4_9ROSI|nr:hypothetical protein OIU84_008337 [Salix udensis]
MASRFQAVALVASPSYPNSIAWSDDNFIVVASAHLVTILNPAVPYGPRGLIRVPTCEPYPIGRVNREEGRVKIYRPPFYDFSAEWVDVVDIATTMKLSSDQAMEFGYDGDATAWNRDAIGVD